MGSYPGTGQTPGAYPDTLSPSADRQLDLQTESTLTTPATHAVTVSSLAGLYAVPELIFSTQPRSHQTTKVTVLNMEIMPMSSSADPQKNQYS